MPVKKRDQETGAEEVVEPRLVGDSLPLESDAALSGSPVEDIGAEKLPPPTSARGRRAAARKAAESGDTPPVQIPQAPLPQRASKLAVETAGDFYAMLGVGASVARFPMAGVAMQAQKDEAGRVLANWALANSPRMYSFLESAGKATAILPLIVCPVMAEAYMRTENPLLENMCAGILEQYLSGTKIVMPNPDAPEGKSEVNTWEYLSSVRAQVSEHRATMRSMEQATAPVPPMQPEDNGAGESSVEPDEGEGRNLAKILRGDGWQDG